MINSGCYCLLEDIVSMCNGVNEVNNIVYVGSALIGVFFGFILSRTFNKNAGDSD